MQEKTMVSARKALQHTTKESDQLAKFGQAVFSRLLSDIKNGDDEIFEELLLPAAKDLLKLLRAYQAKQSSGKLSTKLDKLVKEAGDIQSMAMTAAQKSLHVPSSGDNFSPVSRRRTAGVPTAEHPAQSFYYVPEVDG